MPACYIKSFFLVHCPDMLMVRINNSIAILFNYFFDIFFAFTATKALHVPVAVNVTVPVDLGES